jgi:hypothetical protein
MERVASAPPEYAAAAPTLPPQLKVLMLLASVILCIAGVFGGATNAINAWISPDYFHNLLGIGWSDAVARGVLEGSAFGLLFSLIVTTTVAFITGDACDYRSAFLLVGRLLLIELALWIAGGVCGLLLAAGFPGDFRATFFQAPDEHGPLLRFAWVGGSIWGAEFAGLAATVFLLIRFAARWRRKIMRE